CSGTACSDFAQIGTTLMTSYADTGLAAGTAFSYRVRAADAAGNRGPYSNAASATTSTSADTQPPTAPTTLTATTVSAAAIDLAWGAATDDVGVAGYVVERCSGAGCSDFAQIGTPTTTSFADGGLPASTTFSYRVRAVDAAGNHSLYSNTAAATTSAAVDTQPPTAPASLTATAAAATQINLAWVAATDDVAVASYAVERCSGAGCSDFAPIGTATTTSFADGGLPASTTFSYRVRAADAAGNRGPYSNTASAMTSAPVDTEPPTAPTSLTATAASTTQINLAWVAATDDVGVASYIVERCSGLGCSDFAQIGTAIMTSYADAGVADGTTFSYRVRAADAAGNQSPDSNTAVATTPAIDRQPPTAPASLTATATSSSQISLGWTAASDDVGVTEYLIERCAGAGCSDFAQVGTSTATSFGDSGLTGSTAYGYRVRATDAAGHLGAYSNVATATTTATPPPPDTTPPSAPASLAATAASYSQINLTWTAATDNVGVTGYQIERCQGAGCSDFAQVATTSGTSFNDVVAASTSYSYRVRATDAAANLGPYSNTAAAVTPAPPDVDPPSAPAGLAAALAGSDQIDLTWTAATDNVGVAGYMIERCAGAGCSNFAQIATSAAPATSDAGLARATSYSYRVRAADAAGNAGAYSNVATAATATGDIDAPTAPSSLVATVLASGQINLTWTAATDDTGVTGYLIERCAGAGCSDFAQIATATNLAAADTGVAPATSYSYRVRATDAAANLGPYSNVADAQTPPLDTQPPTAPFALSAIPLTNAQMNLSWPAATDDVAVTGYHVERCAGDSCATFAEIGTTTDTTFADGGLAHGIPYSYRVRANDAAGNLGPYSPIATGATPVDTSPLLFVQGNYQVPQAPPQSVTVPFLAPQAAGDLNVVIVGWIDGTSLVDSVTDTAGNVYQLAIGPTVFTGVLSQSIYYAANIKASITNSVTVTFNQAATYPDVRILQYHGLDANDPLDGVAGGSGSSDTSITPMVTTTSAMDLLVTGNDVETGVTAAGLDLTLRMITDPNGDLVADRVVTAAGSYDASASLLSAGSWVMQVAAFRAATTPPPANDNTPPTVALTAPAAGAVLSGKVTVAIDASDPAGVAGVQLLVDGSPVGAPATTAPYQLTLDTTPYAAGNHTLAARASDSGGNLATSAAIAVTVVTPSADVIGAFSGLQTMPLVSVNAALLPNGNVFMYDGQPAFAAVNAKVWNPTTNVYTAVPASYDIFCSGIEQMADGRIMVLGGHNGAAHLGLQNISVFDPADNTWDLEPDMLNPRWYPTGVQLRDGTLLVIGGESTCNGCNVAQSETYDPATDLWTAIPALMAPPYYPHAFELSDGRIFVSSCGRFPMVSQVLDRTTNTWSAAGGPMVTGGSAAEYLPDKFIKTASSADPDLPVSPSTAATYVIDMAQASPTWRQVESMSFARAYQNLTLLPDGSLLVSGGGPDSASTRVANAIRPAEIWSPDTETWHTVASMNAPRLYHSIALLMPDGRVWISGGGRAEDLVAGSDQLNNEFYSPPYLYKGARPTITSAPAALQHGQAFTVQTPDAARIAKVSLLRFGAVTHAFNTGQRYWPLAFSAGSGALTVTAPAGNLAAPGSYMLFIIDTNGVPSVAAITHL
ncbi:MAG TPA: galactose oxidase-like domain-containing protein, partial [Polyangia bacterium]